MRAERLWIECSGSSPEQVQADQPAKKHPFGRIQSDEIASFAFGIPLKY
jgi:hypothetical protein